ncbi:MAG: hypothetical protein OJF60_001250 [Burkholderiaceae bacterium]|nr:MAG: hypothetical protein OJF60_001250 [Burkholderiaceae bacterium]
MISQPVSTDSAGTETKTGSPALTSDPKSNASFKPTTPTIR